MKMNHCQTRHSPMLNAQLLTYRLSLITLVLFTLIASAPKATAQVEVSNMTTSTLKIAGGGEHTCAVTATGGARCWGSNTFRQLGSSLSTDSQIQPINVMNLTRGVNNIAAGSTHSCALMTDQSVQCWGANDAGELGNDTASISQTTPLTVSGFTANVSALALGDRYSCALLANGSVMCWGGNATGQLGIGTTISQSTPITVSRLISNVSAIAAGGAHACALTQSGSVLCWGDNSYGQLGDGTTLSQTVPVTVSGLTDGVSAITAGYFHTCAVMVAGGIKCWGWNFAGQLGDGTQTNRLLPVDVSGLSSGTPISAISAGYAHTCALTPLSMGMTCWGNNESGELGIGRAVLYQTVPTDVVGPGSGVSAISTGYAHTCAVVTTGVQCWGRNTSGQVGDGTLVNKFTPALVSALITRAGSIATGYAHTCALTAAGGVKCWGDNISGQLGIITPEPYRYKPDDVTGLTSGASAIDAGYQHTCALKVNGDVKCWGKNYSGELGDGTSVDKYTPVDVIGLTQNISAIAVGEYHSCALTTSSGVKCWGQNNFGQLGDGTQTPRFTAVDVIGLGSGVLAIAAGNGFTCAVLATGGVKCWGGNPGGQLGDGTTTGHFTPMDVKGLANDVSAITAGNDHTCARTTSGIMCWGSNLFGQLGDGTATPRYLPVHVSGLTSGVSTVTAGSYHTCAGMTAGGIKCWGWNSVGQLGDGTTQNRLTPVDVSGITHQVSDLKAGYAQTCVLIDMGGIQCWGWNSVGQLGNGTVLIRLDTPEVVPGLESGMNAVEAGYVHTCAITSVGGVKCWGFNNDGQLGNGSVPLKTASTPVDVPGLTSGVRQISGGINHSCALTTDGSIKCWGSNSDGQLGDGTAASQITPVAVNGLTRGMTALAMGSYHSCALTSSGGVKCWGRNDFGQLGDGTLGSKLTPVDVVGLSSGVSSIAARFEHTCIVTVANGVKCWGGDQWKVIPPTDVPGLTSGVKAIALGLLHTCVLMMTGGVKCWGENTFGQLGDGTTTRQATPTDVIGLMSGVRAIATGEQHTCALLIEGNVKCWGENFFGQVGDGTTIPRSTPQDVFKLSNRVSAITLGGNFGCALMTTGSIQCWGDNAYGQMGANPTWTPVDVLGSAIFMQNWDHFVFLPSSANEK